MYSSPLWLGKVGNVVHEYVATARAVHQGEVGIPCATVHRQLPGSAVSGMEIIDGRVLQEGKGEAPIAIRSTRVTSSPGEGQLNGVKEAGLSWRPVGYGGYGGVCGRS